MSTDDDEALSWAGDESPGTRATDATRPARTQRRRAQDDAAVDRGVRTAELVEAQGDVAEIDDADDIDAETGQTGSVALVLLGLLGGVHLLYVVGWMLSIGALQAAYRPLDALGGVMFSVGLGLAVASPIVWFGASFWFTRSRPTWNRIAALIAGAVLLVPWPFLVGRR